MPVPEHVEPVLARARAAFAGRYGIEPRWAAGAPGRVNLIGEHTDYNGGLVLPIAINRVCVAVARESEVPGQSRIYSDDIDELIVADLRETAVPLEPGAMERGERGVERGSWGSYVLGVIEQFRGPEVLVNLDIAIASSVPLGSGLSSSASVEVAMATLMEHVSQRSLGHIAKAKRCQRAEHEFAGVPCGIMDPLASISGRGGHAMLIDCRAETVRQVRLPSGIAVVVLNSNVKHSLAGGEYARRRATCEAAARKLRVSSLREATLDMLDGRLNEEELRCARHVVSEISRTASAAAALESGDLGRLRELCAQSHASLRDDYRVSCGELDAIVEEAARCPGVVGARMTGGGFGGCAVALVEAAAVEPFRRRMTGAYRARFSRKCDVFEVKAADGAAFIAI